MPFDFGCEIEPLGTGAQRHLLTDFRVADREDQLHAGPDRAGDHIGDRFDLGAGALFLIVEDIHVPRLESVRAVDIE